ncbi:phosphoribosylaminoimidazolesuccinocarboxamide synthase [candidate division WOR-3 bacterium]|uniref:Phosphoribosylaminoimidazole-succinocarboxamide synthase n=1 Tax=candidate division WOR-3 bacterium TaxID=2052148 RepID=A0A937XBW3_UNCW3|nr:phosphoribosylaminoimidazolesuccinocarboxamide synthase [candidate division WOR-3 bacterium]
MVVKQAELPGIGRVAQGKVRDIFEVGEHLMIVATDRLSAFDVVLPDPIPDKGKVLTQLSKFWFERFGKLVPNHVVETDAARFPGALAPFREQLDGRAMLVRRAKPLPVECVVRGYLAGSGWNDYQKTGAVCGIRLPAGMKQAEKLPEAIFTPSTKATTGHDENITQDQAAALVGADVAREIGEVSLNIYRRAAEYALGRGIIIADTKFEFGLFDGKLMWIDEALTPDSSRFWSVAEYKVGMSPPSFDKQFVRDYLLSIKWDKTPPAPNLPAEVVKGTSDRYREAYRLITGSELG